MKLVSLISAVLAALVLAASVDARPASKSKAAKARAAAAEQVEKDRSRAADKPRAGKADAEAKAREAGKADKKGRDAAADAKAAKADGPDDKKGATADKKDATTEKAADRKDRAGERGRNGRRAGKAARDKADALGNSGRPEGKQPPPAANVPLPAKPAPDAATAPKPAPAPAVGHDAKQVPEAQTTPAPPPEEQVSWTDAEVLAARARCVEALAPVVAEVRIADPVRAGQCGAPSPVLVQSIGRSPVVLRPPVTMNCPLVVALHDWLERSVQPLAREVLGEEIASLDGLSGYQCRNRAGGGKLSEHGLANALDILTLRTRSGRVVSVLDHWGPTPRDVEPPADPAQEGESAEAGNNGQRRGDRVVSLDGAASGASKTQVQRVASTARRTNAALAAATPLPTTPEAIFLKRIHAEACTHFKTVLGPDANEDHRNHLHLDLAPRARGGAYCR